MLVFKYLSDERLDVLEKGRLRFTQAAELNDPYEMKPNMEDVKEYMAREQLSSPKLARLAYSTVLRDFPMTPNIRRAIRKLRKNNPARFQDFLVEAVREHTDTFIDSIHQRTFNEEMMILSLSKRCDNQLMWSHYAHHHKGFAIAFDLDRLADYLIERYGSNKPADVTYSNKRYRITKERFQISKSGKLGDPDRPPMMLREIAYEFPFDSLATKSLDWAYEDEVRLLARASAGELLEGTADHPHPVYLYRFPDEAVKAVIAGSNADDRFIEQIDEVRARRYPTAELYRATPDPDTFAMKIERYYNLGSIERFKLFNHYGLLG